MLEHLFDNNKFCGKWCIQQKQTAHEKKDHYYKNKNKSNAKKKKVRKKITEKHPTPYFDTRIETRILMK